MRQRCLSLFLAGALLAGLVPVAQAQTANSGAIRLITSPLPISLKTPPGSAKQTDIKIQNAGSQPETLKVGLLKFEAFGDSGAPKLLDREVGDDYFDWVSFSENQFVIQPNQWKTITMTITVPESAAFGYYYAVTFARASQPPTTANQPQAALHGATATLVLLEVDSPNAKREIKIDHFKADQAWYEFLPAEFSVSLRNEGNVHTAPYGNIFIEGPGGTAAGSVKINDGKGNILPNSSRTFVASWQESFPHYADVVENGKVVTDASGKPKRQLVWDITKIRDIRIGHYTATLVMAYDDGQRDVELTSTTSFWVIPWRLLLGAMAAALFFLVGIVATGRSIWRRIAAWRER
jgi:hypothetical protein